LQPKALLSNRRYLATTRCDALCDVVDAHTDYVINLNQI
jgi:hypothetical protein